MTTTPIHTVFFDVGGTILTVEPSVGHVYADAAARLGYLVDPARIADNFRAAWKASLRRRQENDHVCDDAVLRDEWLRVVIDSFRGLLPEAVAREAFRDLYERFCRADAWNLAAGAEETFRQLGALGLRLGILSNWDSRLEETLESVGILKYFEHRVISWRVGVEKPHPEIFREAIRQAGTKVERILHVGDSLEWDIEPARALGMRTLWITGDDEAGAGVAASGDNLIPGRVRSFSEVLSRVRQFLEG